MRAYRKLLFSIAIYLFWGILYLFNIFYNIYDLCNNWYNYIPTNKLGILIGVILVSLPMFYWFFLMPIFKIVNFKKAYKFGEILWESFSKIIDKLSELIHFKVKEFSIFIISLINLLVLFGFKYLIFDSKFGVELNFENALLFMIGYNFIFLRIISF